MFSSKLIITTLLAAISCCHASGVVAPIGPAAPLVAEPFFAPAARFVAPAPVAYTHAIPQNIPPYASQVSVFNRALYAPAAPYVAAPAALAYRTPLAAAAPYVASPYAAAPFAAAPYAAAPFAAAPYTAAPFAAAPYAAAPFPGALTAAAYSTYPYNAPFASPYVASPYGAAPILRK